MCVCDGSPPSVATTLLLSREEALLWIMAGAKGLSSLLAMVDVG
jgi:hypothetical protein